MAKKCFNDSINESIFYAKIGLENARNEHNEKNETEILDLLSKLNFFANNKQEALIYLRLVKENYIKQKDANNLSITFNKIGSIYKDWGLYDLAMKNYVSGLKVAEECKNNSCEESVAQSYNNIGLLYKDLKEYDKAYENCHKALLFYKKTNNQKRIAYTLNNIGLIYKWLKEYDKALSYFEESLKIKEHINDKNTIANNLGNIGDVYLLNKKYDTALEYFNKTLKIMKANNDKFGIATTLLNLAKVNFFKNNISISEEQLKQALDIAKDERIIEVEKDIYKLFSENFEKENDYKNSTKYLKLYNTIKDSIFNEDNSKKVFEYDIAYNYGKYEKENDALRLKTHQKDEELYSEIALKYLLVLILIIIFLVGTMVFIRSKILQKSRKILEIKNNQIQHINEELLSVNEDLDRRVKERTVELEKEISEKENVILEVKQAYKKAEEANLLKDSFLANINHEIRTPLSAIIGLSEVLSNKINDLQNSKLSNYVNGIQLSGQRLLSLLNNIIDISVIEANDFKINLTVCNLNNIIHNTLELFKFKINEKALKLTINLSNSNNIVGDKDVISKIFADVIDNSIKYTSQGEIIIQSGKIEESNEVFVKISDTGIGIDESYLPHIFETFRQESVGYSRLYQGAGLGLPLAQRMIKLMKGRIDISSKKNKGTIVTLFFVSDENNNISENNISFESTIIPTEEINFNNVEILLVEDDKFNMLYLQTLLENIGKLSLAENGNEAIKIIDIKKTENKVFDLVILDINLPEKWEGITLRKEIIKKYKEYNNVPFIAQSAYSQQNDKQKILNEGFNDFLTKPIVSENLINSIKKILIKN